MGHSLRSTNMTIDGRLSIYGGQGDKKILVSDARGQATWASASLFVDSKPESHYIGELFGGGVVVDVWKEGEIEKCLVAGPECISTVTNVGPNFYSEFGVSFNYGFSWSSAWSNYNQHGAPQIDIGAKSPYFGASNSALISASYSNSAARRCEDYVNPNLGLGVYEDWFLPSIGELKCLFDNAAIFNRVLSSWAASNSWLTRDRTRFTEQEIIYNGPFGPESSSIITYDGYDASNINLLEFGSATRYTRQTTYINNSGALTGTTSVFEYSNDSYFPDPGQPNVSGGGYWSSTDLPGEFPLSISTRNLGATWLAYRPSAPNLPTSPRYTVRPFRIADDTQKFIPFDADWAIITYTFEGNDLDTKTRMVFPTAGVTPFTQSASNTFTSGSNAYSSNWIGFASKRPWYTGTYSYKNFIIGPPDYDVTTYSYDYTPGITSSIPAPAGRYNPPGIGNNVAGTFSILLHSHDNTDTGKESVVVNLNAFKLHFPGQSTIEVECRAWWYSGGNIGKNCNIDIVLYKGGTISRQVPGDTGDQGYFRFINTGHSASYSVSSYPVFVPGEDSSPPTPAGSAGWQIATKFGTFRYNVVGKYGSVTI